MVSSELFFKYCPHCGKKQVFANKYKLKRALLNNSVCRVCTFKILSESNIKNNSYKGIPNSWFTEKQKSARKRGREFEFDIKYIWRIYIKQNRACALSGLPLDFSKETDIAMVSIDRIDNKKGYVKRNIQLLHKDVNFMKWTYSQDYFIELCKLISNFKK